MSRRIDPGQVAVVLVRARNPNNIGAVARAMHDFGFGDLRIVNDYAVPFETARSAVDASSVLARARAFRSVAEAVTDCTLVLGTTAVGARALEHRLVELPEAASEIAGSIGEEGKLALLFGSEKTGLSNDELSFCHWLMTIPMEQYEDARHPSMNLGQAAAVCLYELVRGMEAHVRTGAPEPANAAEVERLTAVMREVLEETGYTRRHPANSDEAQIRRLVVRMNVSGKDAPVWMGIWRQILWRMRGGA
jgi:tRNA/rRNA methyltransferase